MEARILLIEDNQDDAGLIRRAFRKVHPSVELQVVENGEKGIAYLSGLAPYSNRKRYPLPSLVLLDLKIPRKSGLEVLAWIWEQPALERIRVIVLTNSQRGTDIQRAYDLAAEAYLVKPATFDELAELVKRIDVRSLKPEVVSPR